MQNLTSVEKKILWVVGSLERLATLGMIDSDVPYAIAPNAVDQYLKIDEERESITSQEIRKIMMTLTDSLPDSDCLAELLIEYRDQRTDLVKYALSHSYK